MIRDTAQESTPPRVPDSLSGAVVWSGLGYSSVIRSASLMSGVWVSSGSICLQVIASPSTWCELDNGICKVCMWQVELLGIRDGEDTDGLVTSSWW